MKTNMERIIPFVIKQMETSKANCTNYSHLKLTEEEVKECALLPNTNKVVSNLEEYFNGSQVSCKLRGNIVCLKLVYSN